MKKIEMKGLTDAQIEKVVSGFPKHMQEYERRELREMRACDLAGGPEFRAKQLCESFKIERRSLRTSGLCYVWDVEIAGKRYASAIAVPEPTKDDNAPRNKKDREMLAMQAQQAIARALGLTIEMPRSRN